LLLASSLTQPFQISHAGKPLGAIKPCDLRTGTAFRFGSLASGSWRYGRVLDNNIAVAKAVAASAALALEGVEVYSVSITFFRRQRRRYTRLYIRMQSSTPALDNK
jgi:hypothetical protein